MIEICCFRTCYPAWDDDASLTDIFDMSIRSGKPRVNCAKKNVPLGLLQTLKDRELELDLTHHFGGPIDLPMRGINIWNHRRYVPSISWL